MKINEGFIKHKLVRNTAVLFIVQFSNIIAPMMVLPYLSRILGIEGFGKIMVVMSICSLGLIFTDFGFNLSASFKVAKSKLGELNEYINSVFYAKVALACLFSFGVFIYDHFVKQTLSAFEIIYVVIVIFSQACYPSWLFQGLEKMRAITMYMLISKVLYVAMVYIFVHQANDISWVIASYAFSCLIGGFVGVLLILREGVVFNRPKFKYIILTLKEGFVFFISRASYSMYTTASTFIVGAVAGMQQAAFYSAAEKIYQALQALTSPVTQALYPYVAKRSDHRMVLNVVIILSVPVGIACFIGYYLAPTFIQFFYGADFLPATKVFNVFIILTIITFISINFGYPAFAALNKLNVANYTVIFGSVIQIIGMAFLYAFHSISAINVVFMVLITETVIMLLRLFLFVYYKGKVSDDK